MLSLFLSLFSQYALTVLGVTAGTGYSLYKKPKGTSGLGIMLVSGAAGSLGDLVYGYTYACRPEVKAWQTSRLPQQQPQQEFASNNHNSEENSRK
jgi:hypothetical protein